MQDVKIKDYIPLLRWLPRYQRSWLWFDVLAALTVWAVMVPTALAYTGIAEVPPEVGLYTVPLCLLGYAIFGTSRTLVVGPDSATALLSAHTIASFATRGTPEFLTLTAALALLVGICFIAFGLLRLGWIANFIAQPVMKGFVQGLALVTLMTQLPKLLGLEAVRGNFFERSILLLSELPQTHLPTLAIGLGSLMLLWGISRHRPHYPAALMVIMGAIGLVSGFGLDQSGIALVGVVKAGLPSLHWPQIGIAELQHLLPGALAIVLLDYTESLGAAEAAAHVTGGEIDPNQELIGLGVANLGAGLSSGFVVAGSLSQSAVSMVAGGKTQLSSLVHAILILLTLLLLMPLFENLPLAVLAAIVVKAMLGMLNFRYFQQIWRISRSESLLAWSVFFGELTLGVLPGIALGVILSLGMLIYRTSHPPSAILGELTEPGNFRDIRLHPEAKTFPGLLIYRFDAVLFFANANFFIHDLKNCIKSSLSPVQEVLLDAETITSIDITAAQKLLQLQAELTAAKITLSMARVKDPIREQLRRTGVEQAIGYDYFYERISDGVSAFLQRHSTYRSPLEG